MNQPRITIDSSKCIGCGLCVNICAAQNLAVADKKAHTLADHCILCGHCGAVCPKQAIAISGYDTRQIKAATGIRLNPDEVLDVIRFRRTVRKFKQTPIPQGVIDQILEAGRLTHTAKNLQDVSFVMLQREKSPIEQMAVTLFKRLKPVVGLFSAMARNHEIDDSFFFFDAPTVVVILAKESVNGVLAAQNMEFVAEAHGLGVLYSGFFTMAANLSRKIRKAIAIPKGKRAAATLVLGYPQVNFLRSAQRKGLDVRYL